MLFLFCIVLGKSQDLDVTAYTAYLQFHTNLLQLQPTSPCFSKVRFIQQPLICTSLAFQAELLGLQALVEISEQKQQTAGVDHEEVAVFSDSKMTDSSSVGTGKMSFQKKIFP